MREAQLNSYAQVSVPQAERVLFKLCKHYAIKVAVVFDAQRADIDFRYGRCWIEREGECLRIHCQASNAEALTQVQFVMDEHLGLMARDKTLRLAWSQQPLASTASNTPTP